MCMRTTNTPEGTLQGAGDWTNGGVDEKTNILKKVLIYCCVQNSAGIVYWRQILTSKINPTQKGLSLKAQNIFHINSGDQRVLFNLKSS